VAGIPGAAVAGIHNGYRGRYDFGRWPYPPLRFPVHKTGCADDGAGLFQLDESPLHIPQIQAQRLADVGVCGVGVALFPAQTIEQLGDLKQSGAGAELRHDGDPPCEHSLRSLLRGFPRQRIGRCAGLELALPLAQRNDDGLLLRVGCDLILDSSRLSGVDDHLGSASLTARPLVLRVSAIECMYEVMSAAPPMPLDCGERGLVIPLYFSKPLPSAKRWGLCF